MSRMNNTARSLKIISRQNGWDPDQIEGHGSIYPIYHERETTTESDTWPIPGEARDPSLGEGQGGDHLVTPDPGPGPRSHATQGADPYPGMPGAK